MTTLKRAPKKGLLGKKRTLQEKPSLLAEAMEQAPGFTYPAWGVKLKLFGMQGVMTREYHAAVPTTRNIATKLAKLAKEKV